MKIVLSRKGFDSSYGGCPSPIFPDGRMVSLPIPSKKDSATLACMEFAGHELGTVAKDLSCGKIENDANIHRDPDVYPELAQRLPGWRPAFGQAGIAQGHLARQGIGKGDVFLFFGWFRQVKKNARGYAYRLDKPSIHSIFGWLQVGEVLHLNDHKGSTIPGALDDACTRFPWLADHPHVKRAGGLTQNTLYIAAETLNLPDYGASPLPGAGAFRKYSDRLRLTDLSQDKHKRTVWKLPAWFLPNPPLKPPLTYHGDTSRWSVDISDPNHVRLQSVAKGQEFVLEAEAYPESKRWVLDLIACSAVDMGDPHCITSTVSAMPFISPSAGSAA